MTKMRRVALTLGLLAFLAAPSALRAEPADADAARKEPDRRRSESAGPDARLDQIANQLKQMQMEMRRLNERVDRLQARDVKPAAAEKKEQKEEKKERAAKAEPRRLGPEAREEKTREAGRKPPKGERMPSMRDGVCPMCGHMCPIGRGMAMRDGMGRDGFRGGFGRWGRMQRDGERVGPGAPDRYDEILQRLRERRRGLSDQSSRAQLERLRDALQERVERLDRLLEKSPDAAKDRPRPGREE